MSFEIGAPNPVSINARADLAALQAGATGALAKISTDAKAASTQQVAAASPPMGLVSSLAASQTAITSTQNAVNTLQTADSAYGKALSLANQGLILASDPLLPTADKSPIDAQLVALQAEMSNIGANTMFGGVPVFGNPVTGSVNSTGAAITVTPNAIAPVNASSPQQPGSVAEFQAAVSAISDSQALNAGNLVSMQNSLQVLESTIANQQAAIGQALDVRVVKEMMSLSSANIMSDPAAALQAQAMQMSDAVFKLL
jgi:flagellin-like hook-associated protein FlgL